MYLTAFFVNRASWPLTEKMVNTFVNHLVSANFAQKTLEKKVTKKAFVAFFPWVPKQNDMKNY